MSKAYAVAASSVCFGKYPECSVASLGREAIDSVLRDAGIRADSVQAVYAGRSFGGALDGQTSVLGQDRHRWLAAGLKRDPAAQQLPPNAARQFRRVASAACSRCNTTHQRKNPLTIQPDFLPNSWYG